jgi:hypothetical protein
MSELRLPQISRIIVLQSLLTSSYTINVTNTESMKHLPLRTKCSACDNATKPCLFFAYTAPNPQTGNYPRINSEGQEEDVMLYSCVSCVMSNRKCSCLGRIACTDEAKTKRRLHVSHTDKVLHRLWHQHTTQTDKTIVYWICGG